MSEVIQEALIYVDGFDVGFNEMEVVLDSLYEFINEIHTMSLGAETKEGWEMPYGKQMTNKLERILDAIDKEKGDEYSG